MMWPFLLLGAVLGAVAVLLLQGRHNEKAATREWVPLLSPQREAFVRQQQGQLNDGLSLAEIAYRRAHSLRAVGSYEEAREVLKVGYAMIDRFAPNLYKLLAMMAVYSRMASAIAPVQPLRAERFRTTGVGVLVRFAAFAHHLLVTTAERFRFRLYIIGQSMRLLMRGLAHTTTRLLGGEASSPDGEDWDQIADIRSDFRALTDESIESLRALLASLDAVRQRSDR